jgi:hypothetical protein
MNAYEKGLNEWGPRVQWVDSAAALGSPAVLIQP